MILASSKNHLETATQILLCVEHLISKVQYKRSEKGEFHEIAKRDLQETISLLKNFPWRTEHPFTSVALTCPSITLESPLGTFLKIGSYFSGKFALYYLDTNKKVYFKIVHTLEDATPFIGSFFDKDGKLESFEKYDFTIKAVRHFRKNSFIYTVNGKAILRFLMFPFVIGTLILFVLWLGYLMLGNLYSIKAALNTLMLFFFLAVPRLYLFFNYLIADNNKYLRLSKGHDEFLFGTKNNIKRYHKDDIAKIVSYGVHNYRSLLGGCEVYVITLNDGYRIRLTSLLLPDNTISRKFPGKTTKDKYRFFPAAKIFAK